MTSLSHRRHSRRINSLWINLMEPNNSMILLEILMIMHTQTSQEQTNPFVSSQMGTHSWRGFCQERHSYCRWNCLHIFFHTLISLLNSRRTFHMPSPSRPCLKCFSTRIYRRSLYSINPSRSLKSVILSDSQIFSSDLVISSLYLKWSTISFKLL